ncbi:MAG: glucosamine-6-phosphate deaminase [Lachnospiraceae bacterium]|nr:glucosamine-6-phosphate deaminase [Lachnospiraceae bacterium]
MKFITVKTYEELSHKAATMIASQIILKPDCVLGLATGSTPVGTYQKLAALNKRGDIDFSKVTSVNLDEYVGLTGDHDQSYRYFMDTNLFNHINIDKAKTHVPNGCAADLKAEGEAYDELIKELGGIDLQLLGIGVDGHIGFNEPDSVFTAATHEVILDASTIEANARFFEKKEDVPKTAITMGMMSIMQAKKILLVANGSGKKEILKKALTGPVDPMVPASVLQLHPDVTVIFSEN